ncbi:collagen alpha-4(VI) chain-like [Sinocyclocheilus grahami]|uniref:collagen alpha-4(VI) chain-like n=1 Tax=Sinocyclocheilus grahami TaxID=75366 RepID=UPI0007ACB576|nr:PREDICTED: collagen alpha-4(VI) chain-like [Sinocyclocheilus grahami]
MPLFSVNRMRNGAQCPYQLGARGVKCRGAHPSPGVPSESVDKEKQALMSPGAPLQLPAVLLAFMGSANELQFLIQSLRVGLVPSMPGLCGTSMEKEWGLLGFLVLSLSFLVSNGQNIVCAQNTVADIVFLVDGSNSIGPANFQQIREFLSSLVENFEVAPDRIRIGLVQYSDTPYTEFSLSTYQNKEEILSYIKNLRYKTGGTFTGKGLEFMLKQHFVEKAGSRAQQNVPQIAIVITDGDSQDEVKSQAQELRQRGIKIFAIGIKDANETLLRQIASEPYDQHGYSVSEFAALQGISQSVIRKVCTAVEETQKEVILMSRGIF